MICCVNPLLADVTPFAHHTHVRLVAVNGERQPVFLVRALELQTAIREAVAALGVQEVDMPALYGFCVQAARLSEERCA